ncbi:MAG: porin family protein [Candidatus Paracaedibacteraceae bacterium]|nr:porin family protein [Candidatus Paracaedibacteraceae bacterium]
MKKIIASAVIAAATLSASQAAVFNGASAGLTMGTLTSKFDNKVNGTKFNASKTFGSYGIHFDYDRSSSNSFYWGLGLDFAMYSGKMQKTSALLNRKLKATYSWSSEFDVRLGYNFCNHVAVYGLAGLRLYDKTIKMFNATTNVQVVKESKTRLAPTLGLGAKVKVSDAVSFGAEYRYAFERKETLGTIAKSKQSSHAALVKVSYHF